MNELNIWNALKVKIYYNLSFKFDYIVLSRRWRIKTLYENEHTRQSRMAPCLRDADLKNGSRRYIERERTHL
jgi:hypothetical protein